MDIAGQPVLELGETILSLVCTCTNGNLPSRLKIEEDERGQRGIREDAESDGDFTCENMNSIAQIEALRAPTQTLRPAGGRGELWDLISHLSLNYLSLVDGGEKALQEILSLYCRGDARAMERQIAGITSLKSFRETAAVSDADGVSVVRGRRVEMKLNEEEFAGGGAYLFACVLERFLSQYVSMNSFSQLNVTLMPRNESFSWPPRTGEKQLL